MVSLFVKNSLNGEDADKRTQGDTMSLALPAMESVA